MPVPEEVAVRRKGKKGKWGSFCRGCGVRYDGGGRGPKAVLASGSRSGYTTLGITTLWRCQQCGRETETWRPYPDGV